MTLKATPASVTGSGAGNGPYTSEEFDTTATGAGEYHWIARFTGDANNNAAAGECLEEGENSEVEEASPEIATDATASVTVGAKIKDVATLSGLVSATGTGSVSFDLYKGEDCTEETFVMTLKATPSSVTGSGAGNGPYTSEEFDTTSTGTGEYHWIARFTGDANNNAAAGECLEEGENSEVEEASPEIATDATASVTVGAKIKDVATLSGLVRRDRNRLGQLRPLQGRRLHRRNLRHDAESDPVLGDRQRRRQRPLHL